MKQGPARFDFFLNQLQALFDKAAKQRNPGLWLYQNNARTPLFMLESLAKLYSGIHNKKKFRKLDAQFKHLEDILGSIDYYDSFAKEFGARKTVPANVIAYLQAQSREKIQSLNEALKEQEWLGNEKTRIERIRKKLRKADWMPEQKEVREISAFYQRSTAEIIAFTSRTSFHFTNVESDVHELRRKLRWLSIYPHALRGTIQLAKGAKAPKYLNKYLSKEIIGSPFNKLPDAGENTIFLLLDQNYFYALSWLIAELGRLKDSGLRVIAIKEALQQLSAITNSAALKKAYQYAGGQQPQLKQVLDQADETCKTYFREQNLQKLLIGVAKTVK
jgi:hypothetical protein